MADHWMVFYPLGWLLLGSIRSPWSAKLAEAFMRKYNLNRRFLGEIIIDERHTESIKQIATHIPTMMGAQFVRSYNIMRDIPQSAQYEIRQLIEFREQMLAAIYEGD